jgi:hypothetical protein
LGSFKIVASVLTFNFGRLLWDIVEVDGVCFTGTGPGPCHSITKTNADYQKWFVAKAPALCVGICKQHNGDERQQQHGGW